MGTKKIQLLADLALVLVTMVWGATFVTVKEAIKYIEPFYFLAIRFGIATLLMLVLTNKRIFKLSLPLLVKGFLIGAALFAGYAFQTIGLKYTSVSNAGFITGLAVVFVPIATVAVTRKLPGLFAAASILSATVGLALLTLNDTLTPNYGDILVFFCAVSYTIHILLLGKFSPDNDSFVLATVQIAAVTVFSFAAALIKETAPIAASFNPQVWQAILITAIPATALAFLLQTWTQKHTSPTHTAIIFTTEPVFAALFAFLLAGETFTMRQGLGAVFIIAGMLTSELGSKETTKEIAEESFRA